MLAKQILICLSFIYLSNLLIAEPDILSLSKNKQPIIEKKYDYDSAGVLPVVRINNTFYAALEKTPEIKQLALHGAFMGMPDKRDLFQPQLTAARVFSNRADIGFKEIINLLKEQCTRKNCIIKSRNSRSIIFPLLVSIDVLDDNKVPSVLIPLNNLEGVISQAARDNKTRDVLAVAQGGAIIKLRTELVEALVANAKSKKTIFAKLKELT